MERFKINPDKVYSFFEHDESTKEPIERKVAGKDLTEDQIALIETYGSFTPEEAEEMNEDIRDLHRVEKTSLTDDEKKFIENILSGKGTGDLKERLYTFINSTIGSRCLHYFNTYNEAGEMLEKTYQYFKSQIQGITKSEHTTGFKFVEGEETHGVHGQVMFIRIYREVDGKKIMEHSTQMKNHGTPETILLELKRRMVDSLILQGIVKAESIFDVLISGNQN